MFVGGISGFILDNTVPGATKEQRGLKAHKIVKNPMENNSDVYSFSPLVMKLLEKIPLTNLMPFLPHTKSRTVAPVNHHISVTTL